MKQRIKIYRMPIARVFPATHPRAGEKTHFTQAIINGQGCSVCSGRHSSVICIDLNCNDASIVKKIHTIRVFKPNSKKTWTDKIREVKDGKAVLVVYQWDGKPYSKEGNTTLFVFGTDQTQGFINEQYKCAIPIIDSGIGVQKALFVDEL
ncbi:MAG: hypothetical protein LBD80_00800, partial [Tannerella sp.]|nr:hypothetical protein [Tannerella sp.]